MDSLVSVIVPVYNVLPYLDRCVNSILKQKYYNLEIILVDDGSTDSSGERCDYWASLDSRIKVIHKVNGGLASARNTGLDASMGDYIGFVDADDFIMPGMYDRLMANAMREKAELSIVSYKRVKENGDEYTNSIPDIYESFGPAKAFQYINSPGYFYVVAWDKLAKKELFENLRYPLNYRGAEDSPVTYKLIDYSTTIVYDSTPEYCYCDRGDSESDFITPAFSKSTAEMVSLVRRKYPESLPYAVFGHLESIVTTYNKIVQQHKRSSWKEFESYSRHELKSMLPYVKKTGVIAPMRYFQWDILRYSAFLYSLMYGIYKHFNSSSSSH